MSSDMPNNIFVEDLAFEVANANGEWLEASKLVLVLATVVVVFEALVPDPVDPDCVGKKLGVTFELDDDVLACV
jgi:hypothetical protein